MSPSMTASPTLQRNAIRRYLKTGEHDWTFAGWNGNNLVDAERRGHAALVDALLEVVRARTATVDVPVFLCQQDVPTLKTSKLAPMVDGLFPASERALVLAMLTRSVVFLGPDNIEQVLRSMPWLHTGWSLANLYLVSMGARRMSRQAPNIVGLSQESTCYVSLDYFREQDPFADYVVHEAAHVFHNCKRATVGLPATRRREWLLDIDYRKRETFAYACEAFSRMVALGGSQARRREALVRHADGPLPGDASVENEEYLDILKEAITARNGWTRILNRCAPSSTFRRGVD